MNKANLVMELPVDFIMCSGYNIIIIYAHFYLFKFLKTQTDQNKSLTDLERKKNRIRNFISVKNGFLAVACFIISSTLVLQIYSLKVR